VLVAVALALSIEASARAEEAPDAVAPSPTWKLALLPVVGVGYTHVGNSGLFPNNIGTTILGGEMDASYGRYGGVARVQYLSSGDDGRWTAMSYGLGGSYRVFGDGYDTFALIARGGLFYEHWRASTAGCPIDLFFPRNCKDFVAPPGSGIVDVLPPTTHDANDALGIFAGARVELPLHGFFVAFDAEIAPGIAFGDLPGALLQARLAIVVGLKHRRRVDAPAIDTTRPRGPRGGY
jgi:hypothetical protein